MPEGDTIHRTAARLRRAIAGARVERFESPRRAALEARARLDGRAIEAVEARGKYLLVRFDDGRTLETHMKMNGSWHLYRTGERWRVRRGEVVAAIHVAGWVAVCAGAPICRLVRGISEEVARLGPDLLDPRADLDEAVRRMMGEPSLALGIAVMRQDLVAGIGNVYKSELLFERRLDPFAPIGGLSPEALRELLALARRHLRRNLRTRIRGTRRLQGGQTLWVYGRSGEPCYECGGPIRMVRQGRATPRSTYFCPGCQAVSLSGPTADDVV